MSEQNVWRSDDGPVAPCWELFKVRLMLRNVRGTKPKLPKVLDAHADAKTARAAKAAKIKDFGEMKMKAKHVGVQEQTAVGVLNEQAGNDEALTDRAVDRIVDDWPEAEDVVDQSSLGFLRIATGDQNVGAPYVQSSSCRAHLKSCSGVLRVYAEQNFSMKQFGGKSKERLYIFGDAYEDKVFWRDEVFIRRPDGVLVGPPDEVPQCVVHGQTPQGPRHSLKAVEQYNNVMVVFWVGVFRDGTIKPKHLAAMLDYGGVQGFNGDRSMQYGQYARWDMRRGPGAFEE